jgi:hypothetical protein
MTMKSVQFFSLIGCGVCLVIGLAAVPPAAASPLAQTSTPTSTPSPTLTPTPSPDVIFTLEPDGQAMLIRYAVTAGDLLNATISFATLLVGLVAVALLVSRRR